MIGLSFETYEVITTLYYIGAPRLVRTNHGTENVNTEMLQTDDNEINSFTYGKYVSIHMSIP